MRKYIRFFKPGKRRAVIIISSRNIKSSHVLTGGSSAEADDYFHDPDAMEQDGIIACVDLRKVTINGRRAYFPCGTYVHPDFRDKGFGIALYKACLMCIAYKMESFKSTKRPLFVQHRIADDDGTTSVEARRIYKALVKRGYLRKVAAGSYKIRKFPKLKYKIID